MAKKIIWRHKARLQFDAIIDYLSAEWGGTVTTKFVVRTYEIIDILSDFPEIGIEDKAKQIRGIVISKHNTLYYRVEPKQIIRLSFFNNRQNPDKRSDI